MDKTTLFHHLFAIGQFPGWLLQRWKWIARSTGVVVVVVAGVQSARRLSVPQPSFEVAAPVDAALCVVIVALKNAVLLGAVVSLLRSTAIDGIGVVVVVVIGFHPLTFVVFQ